ncbi:A-agglutinin anchorage subunit [Biomphalaria pfeifferi]|uniref:A-agglutinin anchorage subunit n=1 Tax=Biomphalaria pfeifferi TaxID=112525 RepID=A0AAD8BGB1_BIOPF|nr:A-agglutinin anchorage subunit [Biomphalaria pfeifferi]
MRPASELRKINFKLAVLEEVENNLLSLVNGINYAKTQCRSWIQESEDFSYFEIKYLISEQSSRIVQHCFTIADTIHERLQNKTRLHSTRIYGFREAKNTLQQNLQSQEVETMAKFKEDMEAMIQTLQDEMKEELSSASCFMAYLQAECQTLSNQVKEINETNNGQNEKITDMKVNANKLLAKILASQARLNEEVVKNEKSRHDLESTKINISRLTHKLNLADDELKKQKQEIKLLKEKTFGSAFNPLSETPTTTKCQPFIKSDIASFGFNSSNPRSTLSGCGSVSASNITSNDAVGSGLKVTTTTTNSSGFRPQFAFNIGTSNNAVRPRNRFKKRTTSSSGFGSLFATNITTSNNEVGSGLRVTDTTTKASGFESLFATHKTTSNDVLGSGLKVTNTTTNLSGLGSLFATTMTTSSDAKGLVTGSIPKTTCSESGTPSSDLIVCQLKSLEFSENSVQISANSIVSRTINALPAKSVSETINPLNCLLLKCSAPLSMFSHYPRAAEFPDSTLVSSIKQEVESARDAAFKVESLCSRAQEVTTSPLQSVLYYTNTDVDNDTDIQEEHFHEDF